jgi:cystathionine beta-synthase
MRYDNILKSIGRTPLIRLNNIAEGLDCEVWAKCEFFNPGGSVKDRIAVSMIDAAEAKGLLKPGGTIIEGTSGNTGIGLALVAAIRGYKIVFTITDKQSREKINFLKALGAEVIVCPTAVAPDDPRSYYSVAKKLSQEIPGAFYPNQYENPENPEAHYLSTGPEIWSDTHGKVTHFVAGMGTGGTISGIGRFLKEKNRKIKVIGADPEGSIYYDYFHSHKIVEAHTYKVEGIGEDILPGTMDFKYVDDVIRVDDKESFLMTRRLANQEGMFTGGSSGSAMLAALEVARKCKKDDLIVVLLPDTGMRYLSKIYNEEWMQENQYFESDIQIHAEDLLRAKGRKLSTLVTASPKETVESALRKMRTKEISQLPVFEKNKPVGSIGEDSVLNLVLQGKPLNKMVVREIMGAPFPVVDRRARMETITHLISAKASAVLVKSEKDGGWGMLTKYDLVRSAAKMVQG